jgi:hypothetical protein
LSINDQDDDGGGAALSRNIPSFRRDAGEHALARYGSTRCRTLKRAPADVDNSVKESVKFTTRHYHYSPDARYLSTGRRPAANKVIKLVSTSFSTGDRRGGLAGRPPQRDALRDVACQ